MIYDFNSLTPTPHLFTASDFNNLKTFLDTPLAGPVEKGVIGGPSGGNNSNPASPNGSINVVNLLTDLLHTYGAPALEGSFFELQSKGLPLGLGFPGPFTLASTSAHNQATPPDPTLGGLNGGTVIGGNAIVAGGGFADVFGPGFGLAGTQLSDGTITFLKDSAHPAGYDLAFQTESTGFITKDLTPEPASMIVWSLIACGFGVPALRRRKAVVAE
jgi:hypothetical protein